MALYMAYVLHVYGNVESVCLQCTFRVKTVCSAMGGTRLSLFWVNV